MSDQTVRVGVLLSSYTLREWEKQALVELFNHPEINATPEVLIVDTSQTSTQDAIRSHLADLSLWKVYRLVTLTLSSVSGDPWYSITTPVSKIDAFDDTEIIECAPIPADGLGNELPSAAVSALTEVDVAIRFGFGIIKGDALTAPKYGMLSYHHGDLKKYRGRPAGFHEFSNREPTVGVTVQRLNESLDGGEIAASTEVEIGDTVSWREVLDRLYQASPTLLPMAIQNCIDSSENLTEPNSLGDLYTMPSNRQTVKYLIERWRRILVNG